MKRLFLRLSIAKLGICSIMACKFPSKEDPQASVTHDFKSMPLPFSDAAIMPQADPDLGFSLIVEILPNPTADQNPDHQANLEKKGLWLRVFPHPNSRSASGQTDANQANAGITGVQYTLNEEFSVLASREAASEDLSMEIFLDRPGFHEITAIAKDAKQQHVTASLSLFLNQNMDQLEVLTLKPTALILAKDEALELTAPCPGGKTIPYWHVALEDRGQSESLTVQGQKGLVVITAVCQDGDAEDLTYMSSSSFYFIP